jgi:hypothetical protein
MASFATSMPSNGEEPTGKGASQPDVASPLPAPDTTRRVRATPKKLKKVLGGIPAKILESSGITLDHDDTETLDEAGEFLGDIFGFEFSVPESKVTVQSRFWAIVWVIGVGCLVYIKHRFPEVFKAVFAAMKKENSEETATISDGT